LVSLKGAIMNAFFRRFCHAVIYASLYWTGEDEANCPALKYLRTIAGYHLWNDAGRPVPKDKDKWLDLVKLNG